ncbi:MAG TPA: hypothetical protein VFR95_09855 [Gemmatimonadaceae bacterium]|nr:hypothetical protein [Gemmatimonadaceae bacterium]
MPRSWRALAAVAGVTLVLAGCQEDLAGGAACPALCPDTLTVRDTVLFANEMLATDVTLPGSPALGTEAQLLAADYVQSGDRLHTGVIFRFDSVQRVLTDTTGNPPKAITSVDTASLRINIATPASGSYDSTLVRDTAVTFVVYDVDAPAGDFDTAAVRARFGVTEVGSLEVLRDSLTGTISIPLDTAYLASHIRDGKRIRLGLEVRSDNGAQVRIFSVEGGSPASLQYIAFAETTRFSAAVSVNTRSSTGPAIRSLADYILLLDGAPPPPDDVLAAGGIPSSRIFLRFDIPPALIDSSTTIVRANLEMSQQGNDLYASDDTVAIVTRLVRATREVSDPAQAAVLSVDPVALSTSFAVPAVRVSPAETRVDTIPLAHIFLFWKAEGPATMQRSIVLQSSSQGLDPRRFYLHSSDAADESLRPRLRITYIPRSGFGLP